MLTCGCFLGTAQFAVATVTTGNRELWELSISWGIEDIIGVRSRHPVGQVWGKDGSNLGYIQCGGAPLFFPVVTPPEPVRDLPRTETQNPAHKSGDRLVQSTGGHPPLFALNQAESNLRILIFFNKI